MPEPLTASLEVIRDHPNDIQDRPVYVWLDGEKWDGVLRYGATFTRPLAPGRHTLKVHNTLFSHQESFEAEAGETIRFRCENGLTGGGMVMVLMLGVAYLRVRLRRLPPAVTVGSAADSQGRLENLGPAEPVLREW